MKKLEKSDKTALQERVQQLERQVVNLKKELIELRRDEKARKQLTRDIAKVGGLVNDLLQAADWGNETELEQAIEALRKWLDKYAIYLKSQEA